MPAGIRVLQRVVDTVAVAVEGLRIGRVGNYGVRADETPDRGVVVSGVVEVEASIVQPLAGEALVGVESARYGARAAVPA